MPAAIAIPSIISAGATVAGGLIQSHAANNATDAQTQAANQALGLSKDVYTQQRADLSPYRQLGTAALGRLGQWSGYPAGTVTPSPVGPFDPGNAIPGALDQAQAAPFQKLNIGTNAFNHAPLMNLGVLNGQVMVKVKAPDGTIGDVPASQLANAIKAGGSLYGGQ